MYVMGNVTSMYLALRAMTGTTYPDPNPNPNPNPHLALRAMTGTTMIAMFGPGKVRALISSLMAAPAGGVGGGVVLVVVSVVVPLRL